MKAAMEQAPRDPARPLPARRRRLGCALRALAAGVALVVLLAAAGALALHLTTPDVGHLRHAPPETTAYIALRREEARRAGRPFDLRWEWTALEDVHPVLQEAVVLAEDRRFYRHGGIDPKAVRRVLREAVKEGAPLRGASTITQQLARNLFLSPERSVLRKLREAFIARRLERTLPKDRILELYLNVAEWGDGIFGVGAASRHYFGRGPDALTPAQAARLAVALPAPRARPPDTDAPTFVADAAVLVARLCIRGVFDEVARDEAFAELGVTDATRPPDWMLVVPEAGRRPRGKGP